MSTRAWQLVIGAAGCGAALATWPLAAASLDMPLLSRVGLAAGVGIGVALVLELAFLAVSQPSELGASGMRLIATSIVVLAGALLTGLALLANALAGQPPPPTPWHERITNLHWLGVAICGVGLLCFAAEMVAGFAGRRSGPGGSGP